MSFEHIVLTNLLYNEEYGRKVIPFLRDDYFSDTSDKVVYHLIDEYIRKYNDFPSKRALEIELSSVESLNESIFKSSEELITSLVKGEDTNLEWLLEKTERFCQERAIYNAIRKSISILDDKEDRQAKGAIPQILSDALAVSFDTNIGHDFIEDSEHRYEYYHLKESKIPFDLDLFNKITRGGVSKKTLNIALAGTGVGKSLFMCHCAAGNLVQGNNVLYITLEMAEEKIAERIDANLLDISLTELETYPKDMYDARIAKLKRKTVGKLIIKEYPTACAGAANFRHLLNELKLKKNFVPDIIYIDYLNICMSSRLKNGANINSYTYIKAIAEELRGLAIEYDVPIFSATQTTRSGYSNSDVGLEDTSESFGLPATADFMFALITSEELADLNQIMVKQLKNRYADPGYYRRFVVGIDRPKMRLYDVEQSAQDDIIDTNGAANTSKSVFDRSKFGSEDSERGKKKENFFDSKIFKDFK